jgi:hypothetical protein
MLRRNFLARLAAGTAALGFGSGGDAFAYAKRKQHKAPHVPNKLDRIAISTWSFRNYFKATRSSDFTLPGSMIALLDFPEMIAERYKVHHLEACVAHIPSTEPEYLRELKYVLTHTQSTIIDMPVNIKECDSDGTFSDPDREKRMAALEAVKQWVDVAHALGVRSVCVGPGSVDTDNFEPTVESYKSLVTYAQARGVQVIVENTGAFGTEDPQALLRLLKLAGPGHIGSLPDFGNPSDEPTRERALKLLFPYAQTVCHVGGFEPKAEGNETSYNFPALLEIARNASFRGVYAINFDGPGDPYAGIQRTLDELLKYL